MTNRAQLIKARLAILAMAAELKNVVRVCKMAGVSRSHFYAMKKAYETQGKEGLAPRARRKPLMPNRTPPSLERHILLKTFESPAVSYVKLANKIQLLGIAVTPAMVRYVWEREGLSTRSARIQWVKMKSRQRSVFDQDTSHSGTQGDRLGDRLSTAASPMAVSVNLNRVP